MQHLKSVRIPIDDLGCAASDAPIVERELGRVHGVLRAYVNPVTETAYVEYDATQTDAWNLAVAIAEAGFRAGPPDAE